MPPGVTNYELTIAIGEMPILIRTTSAEFAKMLAKRYGEFVSNEPGPAAMELDVELLEVGRETVDSGLGENEASALGRDPEADVSVGVQAGRWTLERGDFHAEWDPASQRGWVRQTVNPYSIDGVLRILHSLILARTGGFLLHAASAVRNGRAFVFAGVSGAGKTTISRLAPPDVILLTDEITYIREVRGRESEVQSPTPEVRSPNSPSQITDPEFRARAFQAYGTPFAGELARIGEKVRAPLAGLFLLKQGPENCIEPVSDAEAVRELMRHVLFFAHDAELVKLVFETVCNFVKSVPVRRLVFKKDASVWEKVQEQGIRDTAAPKKGE